MSKTGVKVAEAVQVFRLEVLNQGADYDKAMLTITDVNRPGLQFLGFFDYFDPRRLQIIGKAELTYLDGLENEARRKCYDNVFQYEIPALVISRNLDCSAECMASAKAHQRTLLRTEETTVDFTSRMIEYLNHKMAPTVTRHGVLMDIYGEGVMILGDSGIGKSETAIELVMRGHRLVADDAVEIHRISSYLMGTAPELIRHYIELRGIGVIDVRQLFGMSAIKTDAQIDLVVELEQWDEEKFYDRLGIDNHYLTIMDVKLPCVTIPVRPGRNLASIVEVAAMNNRHRRYGYNAAEELARRIDQHVDEGGAQH
ncbi:MAG: HPr(Ser) kinase/phosphatase [Oscillospiraceae bacterium]